MARNTIDDISMQFLTRYSPVTCHKLKRPLINLQIFRSGNFIAGLLLRLAFYIFKGTTGLTYGHPEVILGTDPGTFHQR